jgi:hypothetical protein
MRENNEHLLQQFDKGDLTGESVREVRIMEISRFE